MATGDNFLGVAAIISSSTAAYVAWKATRGIATIDKKVDKVDTQTNSQLTDLNHKLDMMTVDRDLKTGERDEARRALATQPQEGLSHG